MKKPFLSFKKTDIDFIMRSFVYALLILALLNAFQPYMADSKAEMTNAQVESLTRQTKSITAEEVTTYLETSGRPTMVVIYASWCGYCKKVMPGIYSLWKDRKINGDQMLLISRDSSAFSLSKYILSSGFGSMMGSPVILKTSKTSLSLALRPFGSSFDGGIPYIGFFAPGGQMSSEIMGYAPTNEIEEALVYLK